MPAYMRVDDGNLGPQGRGASVDTIKLIGLRLPTGMVGRAASVGKLMAVKQLGFDSDPVRRLSKEGTPRRIHMTLTLLEGRRDKAVRNETTLKTFVLEDAVISDFQESAPPIVPVDSFTIAFGRITLPFDDSGADASGQFYEYLAFIDSVGRNWDLSRRIAAR